MTNGSVADRLKQLLKEHPEDIRIYSSGDAINALNMEPPQRFENDDPQIVDTIQSALAARRQVALVAAGTSRILLMIAKPGTRLFDGPPGTKLSLYEDLLTDGVAFLIQGKSAKLAGNHEQGKRLYKQALIAFEKAEKLQPNEAAPKLDIAEACAHMWEDYDPNLVLRKVEAAEQLLFKGLSQYKINKFDGKDKVHFMYALCYLALRKRNEAETHLRQVLLIDPDHPLAGGILKTIEEEDAKSSGSFIATTVYGSPLAGTVQEVSVNAVNKATSATAELWDKYGEMIASRVLQVANEITKYGKQQIATDEKYKKNIIDRLWKILPLPVRLLGRKRLRWDTFLFNLRDKIFQIEGEGVRVHPNAQEQIATAFGSAHGNHASTDMPIEESKDIETRAQPDAIEAPPSQAVRRESHPKVRDILSHVGKGYFKDFEEIGENQYLVTTQLTELFEHETYFRFEICSDVLRFELTHFLGFLDEQSTFDDLINILKDNDHSFGTTSCYACLHPPHPSNGVSYVSLQNNHSYLMKWEPADIAEMINLQFHDLKMSALLLFDCDPPIAPAIRVFGLNNPRSTDAKVRANSTKTNLEQVADTSEGIGVQLHAIAAPSTQEGTSTVDTAPGRRDSSPDAGNNTVRCANAVCSKELPADSVFCGYCGTKVVTS